MDINNGVEIDWEWGLAGGMGKFIRTVHLKFSQSIRLKVIKVKEEIFFFTANIIVYADSQLNY